MPAFAETSGNSALPTFLPAYYASALDVLGPDYQIKGQEQLDQIRRAIYSSADQVATISIESYRCDRDHCTVFYEQSGRYFDKQVTDNAGVFLDASPTEFGARWQSGLGINYVFAAKLPKSVLLWVYNIRLDRKLDAKAYFALIERAVNRQRYEETLSEDTVQKGIWSKAIHAYSRQLLSDGKKDLALEVLKSLIATSPFDYEAHIELADNVGDTTAAHANAKIVYDNAEDPSLVHAAARDLGIAELTLDSIPKLRPAESGFQLILIPLPPCDLRLLEQAGQRYEQALAIPVHLARLPVPWLFQAPERIPDQRRIQQAIVAKRGLNVDFQNWGRARYEAELMKTVAKGDALTKFSMQDFITKLADRPDQYDAAPYLDRFLGILDKYRSRDMRTMYVGVTGADIFHGDTNFVFNLMGAHRNGLNASLFSYYRMTAKGTGEPYESRKKLIDRMAKELIPASLGALGIPRPADPSDPYSYADSVARLDQKSFTLSEPTQQALGKFRHAN